jgi:O-antigen ligase
MNNIPSSTKPQNKLASAVEAVFLVLIFSLGFMQPQVNFRGVSLTFTEPCFIVLFILWLLAVLLKRIEFRFDRIYLLFVLYGGGLLLSAVFSQNPRQSLFKLLGEFYLLGLAVLTSSIVRRLDILRKTAFVWIAAASITALIGVLAVAFFYLGINNYVTEFAFRDFGSLPPGNYVRIQSTFLYPAIFANYLTIALMLLLAAWECGWIRTPLLIGLLVPLWIAAAFTLTPGIGGMTLAAGIWAWFLLRKRGKALAGNMALAGGILSAVAFLLVSVATFFSSPTSPFYWVFAGIRIDPAPRLQTWMDAGRTFLAHPIFGNGLGIPVAAVYYMPPSGEMQMLTDAHNFLLNIAGQAGLFGLIPLVLICVAVVRRGYAAGSDATDISAVRRALWIAFISAFIFKGLVGSIDECRNQWVLISLIK